MKISTRYIIAIFFVVGCNETLAQSAKDTMDYQQVLWGVEKRDVIEHAMNLTEFEASAFWPLYEWYERNRRRLSVQYEQLINNYVGDYNSLDNRKSNTYAKQFRQCDAEYELLCKNYYGQIKKVLDSDRAFRFVQIEMRLQNMYRYKSQTRIPFINQMESKVMTSIE